MTKKLFLVLFAIISGFCIFVISAGAADIYPNDPCLYDDSNGVTHISTSFDTFWSFGSYSREPEDFKTARAYVAVYDSGKNIIEVYAFFGLNGKSIDQSLPGFKKGANMRVCIFVWNNLKPLYKSYNVSYKNTFTHSVVFEAEDISVNNLANVSNDTTASGGKTLHFNNGIVWPTTLNSSSQNAMYGSFYVNENIPETMCKVWVRLYAVRNGVGETPYLYHDLNSGTNTFSTTYYSYDENRNYWWKELKAPLYVKPGMNYIAFKNGYPAMVDKVIITSNLFFKPEGMDDEPTGMNEEEFEKLWAGYWNEPEIKPVSGHPRLYVTNDSKDEFVNRISTGDYAWIYEKFKGYAKETLNCTLDTSKSNNHDSFLLTKILSRALCYMTGAQRDISHARTTIAYMKEYLKTVRTPDDQGDITRTRGDIMHAAAIVYDWCYDALTEEDKKYFIDKFKEISASKEIGWPPVNMSSVASHAGEQEIFRDLLSAGVAIYDEYPLMYNLAAGRLFDEMLPARNWLRQAGRFEMGNDYGEARAYSEIWADAIFKAMGYDSIYGSIGSGNLRWLIYSRLPYGSMMPSGDMYTLTRTEADFYDPNYIITMAIASNIYDDPILKQEFNRRFNMGYYPDITQFYFVLFNNPNVESETWDNLPLSSVTKYPLSGALARTSWQEGYEADTAIGFMNMHEVYVGDHQNLYTGDFQIYYKGLLAMNTGTYNASTQHNEGYKKRAVAGNVMLCYDPDETFAPTWSSVTVPNDGGQRNPYVDEKGESKGSSVKLFDEFDVDSNGISKNKELTVSENVKTYSGPNKMTPAFTYVGGDLTNAYSEKVTDYERHMVFMDLYDEKIPAAFVVYDRMTSKEASFKKTWLLHSQEAPFINNDSVVIKRTEGNFNGKLENKILLPQNPTVSVIGGENNEMFTIGGVSLTPKANTVEGGKYRIEVSPSSQNKEDVFLNAMYVTSADSNETLEMTKYEDDSFTGVHLADRLVLFAKEENINHEFNLDLTSFGSETLVFISGLSEGYWKIGEKTSKTENGCAVFKLSASKYTAVKTNMAGVSDSFDETPKKKIGDFFIWYTQTDAQRGYGNYLYTPLPTIRRNSVSYVPAELFKQLGMSVIEEETSAKFTYESKSITVKGFTENGRVYVNPYELEGFGGYSFSYSLASRVLTIRGNKLYQ